MKLNFVFAIVELASMKVGKGVKVNKEFFIYIIEKRNLLEIFHRSLLAFN